MLVRLLLLSSLLLAAPAAAERARNVAAAVTFRGFTSDVRFEDNQVVERRMRRAGVEYREGLGKDFSMGFTLGYSEDEGRDAAFRPFETVGGNFGSLFVHYDTPLSGPFRFQARAEYLLQRGSRPTGDTDFETRSAETRAEFAPALQYGAVEVAAGASWRDIDYREILESESGDIVRHAEGVDDAGAFFRFGLMTDQRGIVSLRYDAGAEEGWTLRFERTFQ